MGKRGPAPKPTAKKKAQGTYRPDRASRNEPTPEVEIPDYPSWFGKVVPWGRQRIREWKKQARKLAANRLLTEVDEGIFRNYCDALARQWYFSRQLTEDQVIYESKSGYTQESAYLRALYKANEDVAKYGAKLGASPSDRTRISVPEKPADEEDRESLLRLVVGNR